MGIVEKTAGSGTEEGGRHKNETKEPHGDGGWTRTAEATVNGSSDWCEADCAD